MEIRQVQISLPILVSRAAVSYWTFSACSTVQSVIKGCAAALPGKLVCITL